MGLEKKGFGPVGERGTGKELVIYRADNCVRGELNYVQFTRDLNKWPFGRRVRYKNRARWLPSLGKRKMIMRG